MALTRPLNLLYLIRTWDLGGSHTIIRAFIKHLPRERFNIIVVPFDAPGDGDARFVKAVESDGFAVAPERIPWRSRGSWAAARGMIAQLIDKYNIECIHAHDTHSNVLVGLGRDRWECACVGSPYGWWEDGRLRPKFYHWVEKNLALPNFDLVYTVSQDMRKKILAGRTKPERIRVIHTGIDLHRLDAGNSREAMRERFGFTGDDIVFGTVSRLFIEKGHIHLVEALAQLARGSQRPVIPKLLIVGTGDQRAAIERALVDHGLREHAVFAGFVDDLAGAYRAMDVFVQPSIDHEGFPTAVLEAQAGGLPVIASDIGGTKETMLPGETGVLVPPGNSEALAAAMQALATDHARRKEMGKSARRFVRSTFTLENMIAQMSDVYEEAVSSYRMQRGAR